MDVKINEFKQLFFSELDKKLVPLGFKYVKSKHGYILKNKKGWYFHFLIDCVKWSASISVETKIWAQNLELDDVLHKICGTKPAGLGIKGGYPLVSKFLGQQSSEKPQSTFYVRSTEDISETAQLWLEYFDDIGMPFIERLISDRAFALNIVMEYPKTVFFPDRCRYLPIMCKELEMNPTEIELICRDLENQFDDFLKLEHLPKDFQAKWVGEYNKVKSFVLNNELPNN